MTSDKMTTKSLVLFISSGLIVFFISAFMVLNLRTKSAADVIVPDLIGKKYIEIHNELVRLQFRVHIEQKRHPEKSDGIILKQSIAAGKSVETGSKLYLTVNTGVDIAKMPDLKNMHLNSAISSLDNVLSGEIYIKLALGGVTYITASDQPPETVISQIPEPGTMVDSSQKVYLLVTEPEAKKKISDLILQPFPIVAKKLNSEKSSWRIKEFISTKKREEDGLVKSVENQSGKLNFQVYYLEKKRFEDSGYEKISYPVTKSGKYRIVLEKEKDGKILEDILLESERNSGENLETVFYRKGEAVVKIFNENEMVKDFTFEPKFSFFQ